MTRRTGYSLLALFLFPGLIILFCLADFRSEQEPYLSPYPDGKKFAFTITDDAHKQTVEKIKPVYDFLYELGMKTTIAVYVRKAARTNGVPDMELNKLTTEGKDENISSNFTLGGDTLQQRDYLEFIRGLKARGFEIAIHTVSAGNDLRETTVEGYEEYNRIFGEYPKMNIMHSNNLENVYWGSKVFSNTVARWLFENIMGPFYSKAKMPFGGEDPESPYFFGDILKERTKYVRMWGSHNINTLSFNPSMPYHDPQKPYVNYWYSFSEGHTARVFNKLLNDSNIDKLYRERGASIVYTHFSSSFMSSTEVGEYVLNPKTKAQLKKIANKKDGWFVPASELLDRLLLMKNVYLTEIESALIVSNLNVLPVSGVTLIVKTDSVFYDNEGSPVIPNDEGEIVIDNLQPNETMVFYKNEKERFVRNYIPGWCEYFNFILKRFLVMLTTLLDR